jgi:hypothetical protein
MSERFLAGGWRIRAAGALCVALPVMGVHHLLRPPDWSGLAAALGVLTGCSFVALGAVFAWGLLHRSRPVIEVGDDALEFGSIYRFAKRRRMALAEIERVDLVGARMRLTLRSGRGVSLGLAELPAESRRAARDAIERRL